MEIEGENLSGWRKRPQLRQLGPVFLRPLALPWVVVTPRGPLPLTRHQARLSLAPFSPRPTCPGPSAAPPPQMLLALGSWLYVSIRPHKQRGDQGSLGLPHVGTSPAHVHRGPECGVGGAAAVRVGGGGGRAAGRGGRAAAPIGRGRGRGMEAALAGDTHGRECAGRRDSGCAFGCRGPARRGCIVLSPEPGDLLRCSPAVGPAGRPRGALGPWCSWPGALAALAAGERGEAAGPGSRGESCMLQP